MLPFVGPMWESDATVRGAVEQSIASSVTTVGQGALVTGGEVTVDARTYDPGALYTLLAHGSYGQVLGVAIGGTSDPPASAVSAEVLGEGGWVLSPFSRVTLDLRGYLASRLGVRAFDELAARDPFLGNRLEYTLAPALGWATALDARSSVRVAAGYTQAGALSADVASAAGLDTHAGRAVVTYAHDVGRLDALVVEGRYAYTHFYHALLDIDLHRGPADVQAGTATAGLTHAFARRWIGSATGGVTVASPPPIVAAGSLTLAPEARAAMSYVGKRYRAVGSYAYGYTSLGPRVGFGQTHTAVVEVSVRPLDGAKYRDLLARGVGRFAYGAAPVAADPPIGAAPGTVPLDGTITTLAVAAGGRLEIPLARGLALLGSADLEYLRATFAPVPPAGSPGAQMLTVVTVGLVGTLSTDPRRTLRPEAEVDERELERRTRPDVSPADRLDEPDGARARPVWDTDPLDAGRRGTDGAAVPPAVPAVPEGGDGGGAADAPRP